jgi:3,4-dihydroxy 2-butanone 4-phosphate synthase/GTP cyclohydrolase II
MNIEQLSCARIPTRFGDFELCVYANNHDNKEHMALILGGTEGQTDVLLRIHSECFTGDVLGSVRCDCGPQLEMAMERIASAGQGVLLYLRQEGRGIGLAEKLRAYNLQDQGYDTVEANLILGHQADERDYRVAAKIIKHLGIRSVRLLTNNPKKYEALKESGIQVTDRLALQTEITKENADYLQTKANRLNHHISLDGVDQRQDVG